MGGNEIAIIDDREHCLAKRFRLGKPGAGIVKPDGLGNEAGRNLVIEAPV